MPSTVVSKMDYVPEQEVLVIAFNSGKTYYAKNVPNQLYIEFFARWSKGSFFNHLIKGHHDDENLNLIEAR